MRTVVRLVYVAYFLEVGLALLVVPWSDLWMRNYFVNRWPSFGAVAGDPFVKGAVSGLGLVNLALGFADLSRLFKGRNPEAPDAGEGEGA
jgi:hypothetical protein